MLKTGSKYSGPRANRTCLFSCAVVWARVAVRTFTEFVSRGRWRRRLRCWFAHQGTNGPRKRACRSEPTGPGPLVLLIRFSRKSRLSLHITDFRGTPCSRKCERTGDGEISRVLVGRRQREVDRRLPRSRMCPKFRGGLPRYQVEAWNRNAATSSLRLRVTTGPKK